VKEPITKLEAHVESLFTLTICAHERFLFLRPMMVNQQLIDRIAREEKGIGFRQLRGWLYWALVQELSKICCDKDLKTPCIANICSSLKDPNVLKALEDNYVKKGREMGSESHLRSEFQRIYIGLKQRSEEMLNSTTVGGYKTIRDKLISHNELRKSPAGNYEFFDVKESKLKYGEERKLLETIRAIVTDLLCLVRNTDFGWDTFFRQEEKTVCDFFGIESINGSDQV
jgi:AbiU2